MAENNLTNVDPLFESVSTTTFNLAFDYHLKTNSPGKGAGTDNTDIGIYGGMYPFPSGGPVPWQISSMPAIPQIIEMTILNNMVHSGGELRVKVRAIGQK